MSHSRKIDTPALGNFPWGSGKQLNCDTLPDNIAKAKESMPELTMMFLYAHPEKLDMVKEKLSPVLGEQHLIIAPEQTANKVTTKFLTTIGR